MCVSSDVFRDKMFACCCECILGVNQYGALQHADGVVCGVLTYNRIRRGQSHTSRGAVKWDVMGVFRVTYFVMRCLCVNVNVLEASLQRIATC